MSGNVDERERPTLARIEAALERIDERTGDTERKLDTLTDRVLMLGRDTDLLKKQQAGLYKLVEARFELLDAGLQTMISKTVRFELSNARTMLGGEVDRLRGELDALPQQVEALARKVNG